MLPATMRRNLDGKVVFITGASSGIGEALGREAAQRGAAVALAARREDRLVALAEEIRAQGRRALPLRCDVTRDGDLERTVSRTREQLGGIDVAIADAGFAVAGRVSELTIDDYRRQLETNVFGVLRTVQAVIPELSIRQGSLAVIGSVNGYVSVPGWSAYCMSKAAVRSLCACLRHELAADRISVTHVAPGFVQSELRHLDNHGRRRSGSQDPVPAWLQVNATAAARKTLRAIAERRPEVLIAGHAHVAVGLERHAPWLVSAVMGASGPLVAAYSRRR